MRKKGSIFLVFFVVTLAVIFAASLLLQPAQSTLQQSVSKAIAYFDGTQEPDALLMLNVMYRRFGIASFADALESYDQILANVKSPIMRVFRRIGAYDNPLQDDDLDAVITPLDQITVPALYCDRIEVAEDYSSTFINAANEGDFELTHALLAWMWIQENDYELQLPDGFSAYLYNANAKLINDDLIITELEIEAAAFLYIAGKGIMIDSTFVDRVIEVQNDDGGWRKSSETAEPSDWHTTVLGLLLLLHVTYPSESYPPMLAPA